MVIYQERLCNEWVEKRYSYSFIVQLMHLKILHSVQVPCLPIQSWKHLFVLFTVRCAISGHLISPTMKKL